MSIAIGKAIPNITLPANDGQTISLADYNGKNIVLYFYPKDSTSGCTKQGEDFRDLHRKFLKENTVVLGVSRDSIKSHHKFIEKYQFPFPLLSDPDEDLCEAFGVMKWKSMYGRKYRGIERSTFLIDEAGKLLAEWRKVKVPGHVQEVFQFLKDLK